MAKYFRPNVQISGRKYIFFSIFPNKFFMVKIIPEIHIFRSKYFYILMGAQ